MEEQHNTKSVVLNDMQVKSSQVKRSTCCSTFCIAGDALSKAMGARWDRCELVEDSDIALSVNESEADTLKVQSCTLQFLQTMTNQRSHAEVFQLLRSEVLMLLERICKRRYNSLETAMSRELWIEVRVKDFATLWHRVSCCGCVDSKKKKPVLMPGRWATSAKLHAYQNTQHWNARVETERWSWTHDVPTGNAGAP